MINWIDIPGETGPTFTKTAELSDTGQYRRLDTNSVGSTPSNAADVVVRPPVISIVGGGALFQGQALASTRAGQWYINDVAVPGETGDTFVVPETVLLGDEIRCRNSIALEVVRIPGTWGVRVDTTRTTAKTTDSDQFHMMGRSGVDETITIYWGDGTKSVCDTWDHADRIHTYADKGVYDMQVVGVTTANFSYDASSSDFPKIVSIDQWGDPWGSNQNNAFRGTTSPHVLAALPDDTALDALANGSSMFNNNNLTTLPDGMTLDALANGSSMFINNNLTTLPDGMTLDALANGSSMFNNNNLTTLPDGMTLDELNDGAAMFYLNNLATLPDGMTLNALNDGATMFYLNNLTTLPDGMTLASLTNGYGMFAANNLTALPDGMTLASLTNGDSMFHTNNLTTLPDSMTLSSLTNGSYMFQGNNLTTLPDGMTLASLTTGQFMFINNNLTALPDGMTLASLTDGSQMFRENSLTALPDSMTLASLTNGDGMFLGSTINTEDYSGLLIRMEANNPNANVIFHGGNSKYNSSAAVARAELVNRGWTIADGGPE